MVLPKVAFRYRPGAQYIWPYSLTVRTQDFHSCILGSNPGRVTTEVFCRFPFLYIKNGSIGRQPFKNISFVLSCVEKNSQKFVKFKRVLLWAHRDSRFEYMLE